MYCQRKKWRFWQYWKISKRKYRKGRDRKKYGKVNFIPYRTINIMENKDKLLKYAVENGMIDLSYVQEQIEMSRKKEILEKHPYKIWKGKDEKWRTYIFDENNNKRRMIKRNSLEEIEKLLINYISKRTENPTIEDVFNEWNDRRTELNKISSSTQERNKQIFKRHYDEFGKKKIKDVSVEELCDFLEKQIAIHNLSAKAFSNLKGITKGFLKRAKKRGLINMCINDIFADMDLTDTSFKKTIKEDNQEVFSDEEFGKVFDYLTMNLDTKNIGILLMFVSGIRIGELVTLKHSDFNYNSFIIRRTETRLPKENGGYDYLVKEFPKSGAGVRTVVIPETYLWLIDKIRLCNPFCEYIFCDNKGNRMTTNCIRRRVDRMCKSLNIVHKSPHKIRKTYGSILLDNNVDRRFITNQMGHTDIATTENYYHRNRRSIEEKTEILNNIPEFQLSN